MKPSLKRFVRVCMGLAAAVLLVALALELSLQGLYRAGLSTQLPYGIRAESPDLQRAERIALRPGFAGTSSRGIEYSVNDLGFRDDPVDTTLAHLIFLGDSSTFGLNVAHGSTYPEVVERDLASRGFPVQSVNTASPGQATLDQRDILLGLMKRPGLNPAAVVLGVFCNDFPDNMKYSARRSRAEERLRRWSSPVRRLRTYRTLREVWVALREARADGVASEPPLDEMNEYAPRRGLEVERDWLTEEQLLSNRSFLLCTCALDSIARAAATRRVPFVLVYMPTGAEEIGGGACPRYKALLKAYADDRPDVIWLDACEVYRTHMAQARTEDLPEDFYSKPGDAGHPGPGACAVLARALVELLAAEFQTRVMPPAPLEPRT